MLKKITLVYCMASLVIAVVTTILQVQPALFFIELLIGDDNKFPVILTMLLTLLILLLPAALVLLLIGVFTKKGHDSVPDLTGKTGILVRRERLLSNALYIDDIMINGEKKAGVSNGKTAFVELINGSYKVFIKGAITRSAVMEVALTTGQIVKLKTGYRPDGLKTFQYLETDE